MQSNKFIILDTHLTDDLVHEGVARELVSKVQQMRKTNNYNITDRIIIYYDGNNDFEQVLVEFDNYIKNDTLAVEITKKEISEKIDLNGLEVGIELKVKEDYNK